MTLQTRDKRALAILAAAALVFLIWNYFLTRETETPAVTGAGSIPMAERRLTRLREIAAKLPARQAILKTVKTDLAAREKGLIQAETAAQAQAQVLQIFRRLANSQSVEIRAVEMGKVQPLGDAYGEVLVPITFECRIEQLLNVLADISSQPEMITTTEMRITAANEKEKTMTVRLTISGAVPRRLVPEKKGGAAF
ncbi:MAG: type II secretion system protein GspM [Bryobacteraceae bacterium]